MKFCIALCLCAVLSLTVAQYESDEDAVEQTPLFRQEQQRIQVEDDSLIVDEEQSRQVRQAYENINVDVVNGLFETLLFGRECSSMNFVFSKRRWWWWRLWRRLFRWR